MEIVSDYKKKQYNTLLITRANNYVEIQKALEITADFIKKKKLILYGGMAIDFALKLKNLDGIYGDDVIPDYDFFSTDSVSDSNELGVIMRDAGLPNISCINAQHKMTRTVRVNFENIADITYRPKHIFDNIPTLEYDGFLFVHPNFQKIDMHRSSVYMYENPPREVLYHRIKKDMSRYRLLEEAYPMSDLLKKQTYKPLKGIKIPKINGVLCGLPVYAIYSQILKQLGAKLKDIIPTTYHQGLIEVPENYIDIFNVCILTDDFAVGGAEYELPDFEELMIEKYPNLDIDERKTKLGELFKEYVGSAEKTKTKKYFNKLLDIIPRRIESDVVLYDNRGAIIATSIHDYEIPNIQWLLMYCIFNYHLTQDIRYVEVYVSTQKLVYEADRLYKELSVDPVAAENFVKNSPFFINTGRYGKYNQSEVFLDRFYEKYNNIMRIKSTNTHPKNFYPSNSDTWDQYDYSLLNALGEEVEPFDPIPVRNF